MYDVLVLIMFMIFGYGMRLVGLNPAVFIIGFILTPFLELNLDQSLALIGDDYHLFFASPFSWIFTALAIFFVYSSFRIKKKTSHAISLPSKSDESNF